ncbi:AlpA family phage regulatory protein [Haemophilus sp. HMSC068C11]|uniref:helix-turn-helix transcriptional regulator n=1 Tax=Haemophilus sp. HMSC068C11 TaxID=1739522 RepID=UPI0008A45035|nr:AlpA family phage regulatory protein [Haemophilus sp. HMSC068C11]OFO64997.1 transcriptional regulator [Haemophilus sp. HMSC068C11]
MNQTQKVNQKLIPGKSVCRIVGFQRTKLNKLVKEGNFPQPIRFSQNFVRWDLEEVNQWIEEQKAARA